MEDNLTEANRMSIRVRFQNQVDILLQDKPNRYQDIIKGYLKRYEEYYGRLGKEFRDIERVIDWMVDLDQEYVSVREDNE